MSENPSPGTPVPQEFLPVGEQTPEEWVQERWSDAEALGGAYTTWLERRGINPAELPHFTMDRAEFNTFRNAPLEDIYDVRDAYGITLPQQYAWVSETPAREDLPAEPNLVRVTESDFGTVISPAVIAQDFQSPEADAPDPAGPLDGTYITVDIGKAIGKSYAKLDDFAEVLMRGVTEDPLRGRDGTDIGIRAGEPRPGQNDTYVWEGKEFTRSMELTMAFPRIYTSICIVEGTRREAPNDKPTMAQIVNPTTRLVIEGYDLKALQAIYQELYHVPDFALKSDQKEERDQQFNTYLKRLLSEKAERNARWQEEDESYGTGASRARQLPL